MPRKQPLCWVIRRAIDDRFLCTDGKWRYQVASYDRIKTYKRVHNAQKRLEREPGVERLLVTHGTCYAINEGDVLNVCGEIRPAELPFVEWGTWSSATTGEPTPVGAYMGPEKNCSPNPDGYWYGMVYTPNGWQHVQKVGRDATVRAMIQWGATTTPKQVVKTRRDV